MNKKWKPKIIESEFDWCDDIQDKLSKIHNIDNIKKFLKPSIKDVHSPNLLLNIEQFIIRVIKAFKDNENIVVIGDPDYDGVSAMTILYKYLLKFTPNVSYLINQRSKGHNIYNLITTKLSSNTNLVIAVDSSSNDTQTADYSHSNNIDFIVIDHHQIENINPNAIVINPEQSDCNYPNKNASGGLVTYKCCQAIDEYMNTSYSEELEVLAGFSIVADAMNMKEPENRYYLKQSLKLVKNHVGLSSLFVALNKNIKKLNSMDFSWSVSPCITSSTRADKIELAVELLMDFEGGDNLNLLIKELLILNEERKVYQKEMLELLISSINMNDKFTLIIHDITAGFRGLIAGDLQNKLNKPTLVLKLEGNILKGSGRSPNNLNLLSIVKQCNSVYSCGGHEGAFGIQVELDKLEQFKLELNDKLDNYTIDNSVYYNLQFESNDIDANLIKKANEFYHLTGNGFDSGKFLIVNNNVNKITLMGKNKDTVKFECDKGIVLMKFKTDESILDEIKIGNNIDVIGTLNINEWYNPRIKKTTYTNQIFIDDYKINEKKVDNCFDF